MEERNANVGTELKEDVVGKRHGIQGVRFPLGDCGVYLGLRRE
jgi:hypothetical protein